MLSVDRTIRILRAALAAACMGAIGISAAASVVKAPGARALITARIDPHQRVALTGHVAAWVDAVADRGAVADTLPLNNLTLMLNRSPEREAAFQQLLKDQQDPSSPNYHHWLTPLEVGEQYGAAQQDIDTVGAWLASQGLHVDGVANGRTRITFSGTAGAVANAFGTALRYYAVGSETRIANAEAPRIPEALSDAVHGVGGLHTIKYHPALRQSRAQQMHAPGISAQPADTYCPGGGAACQYHVFPADFAKIYDLPAASVANGSGQNIAIVGRARVYDGDQTQFKARTSVSFADPVVIIPPSGTDPGPPATTCTTTPTDTCSKPSAAVLDQGEATLDVQRAGSVAPGANLKLIASADTGQQDGVVISIIYAIDTNPVPAKILSISFASCEADDGRSSSVGFDQLYQQAAVEGISVFVASGDGGVAGCAALDATPTGTEVISTNTLCASGFVTCVGGTEFADTANPNQYWSTSNGAGYLSALGYIPEGAWNDPTDGSGKTQFSSTGGGYSLYIATPAWQTVPGVPGTQGRYSPDVSFAASTRDGYLTCIAAEGGSCAISGGSFSFIGSGGTSASAPSMAGIAALLDQKTGAAQGNLNPRLYALAASPSNGVFHDVTLASSGVSGCTVSVPSLCNNSTPGPTALSGGLQGYLVGNGYDLATGLGSIDVANLLTQWNATGTPTFNLNQHGLTGGWYDPNTGGQGFLIETYPDLKGTGQGYLAAGWYTFDVTAPGGQRWYTLQGDAISGAANVPLKILAATGGNFNAAPTIGATQVGSATLTFADCTHGSLSFNFNDGRNGTIALIRVDQSVTCTVSGDSGTASNFLLSGAWYDKSTSGQGFFLDVNPKNTLFFAAWYTYAPNGASIGGGASQRWYTIQDNAFAPGTVSKPNLNIYETTGGVFNNGKVGAGPPVGSATIAFASCTALTISYNFTAGTNAGKSGSVALTRVVGAAPAGCSL